MRSRWRQMSVRESVFECVCVCVCTTYRANAVPENILPEHAAQTNWQRKMAKDLFGN